MSFLENKYKSKAIIRGGLLLFSKRDALEIIDDCKNNKIKILGIDAFTLHEDKIQPSLENSIDFSSSTYVQKSSSIYSDAIDFINERRNSLYFEVVC